MQRIFFNTPLRAAAWASTLTLLCLVLVFSFSKKKETSYEGQTVEDFALMDQNGFLFELTRNKNRQAVVLISYGIGCPIVRKSLPLIGQLAKKYRDTVQFALIDPNLQDVSSRQKLIDEARAFQIHIPLLADDTQRVSKSLGINRTGEALLIETKTWKVIYRGPLTDRLNYGVEKTVAREAYLEKAIHSYLNGAPIEQAQIPSPGCAISYESPLQVTYSKSVAPILQQKCLSCHGEGAQAPTNFWTYEDVKHWSQMIREVIRTERMPPWESDGFHSKINSDPALTTEQKKIIYSWIESGFPEDSQNTQGPAIREEKKSSKIRRDLSWVMAKPIEVPSQTTTPWHYEPLSLDRDKDLWISGIETEVENRASLQHLAILVMKSPLDLSQNIFEPQFNNPKEIYNILRISAKRAEAHDLEEPLAFRIPKGSFAYLELHLAPTGKTEKQNVKIFIEQYRGRQKPNEVLYSPILTRQINIPPGKSHFTVRAFRKYPQDTYIRAVGAHMHMRGHYARLTEITKTGDRKLFYSSRYVFKNRTSYVFETPYLVQAGSRVMAEFIYDNSVGNPNGIDFTKTVGWGQDAFSDEMATFNIFQFFPTQIQNFDVNSDIPNLKQDVR